MGNLSRIIKYLVFQRLDIILAEKMYLKKKMNTLEEGCLLHGCEYQLSLDCN